MGERTPQMQETVARRTATSYAGETRLTMLLLPIGVVMSCFYLLLVVTDLLHKALGSKPC